MNAASTLRLRFRLAPETFTVWRLPVGFTLDGSKLAAASWYSVTRTADELSVVAPSSMDFAGGKSETGWRCLKIEGPLAFNLIGIIAGVSSLLAEANISIFAISTYDTDYFFVRAGDVDQAVRVLELAGHTVTR